MKILHLVISAYLLSSISIYGGVEDYVVYDQRNRYQLEKLDGIVSVKINKFYGFADLGLVTTLIEERKKNADPRPVGIPGQLSSHMSLQGSETVYASTPALNALVQVLRNTLWLFDAEITEVHRGNFQTNRVYIATKPTRAYSSEEFPLTFLSNPSNKTIDFGLIHLDEEEFKHSFRGRVRYLDNSLQQLSTGFVDNPDEPLSFSNEYSVVFKTFTPTPCYVAREIGIPTQDELGQPQESKLIQILRKGVQPGNGKISPTR
jgi:hypothetical protein